MPTAPVRVTLVWCASPNYGYLLYDSVSTQLIVEEGMKSSWRLVAGGEPSRLVHGVADP
jgi:hypothetical protein